MTTPQNEQVQINLEVLDIDGIHKALTSLNIKWNFKHKDGDVERVPTKKDIVNVAKFCMNEAFNSRDHRFEIGGFEAEVKNGIVEIRYVLSRANPLSKLFG